MDKSQPLLLIDDSFAMRQTVMNILRGLGYSNFDEAADGREALRKLDAAAQHGQMYRMIFLDWSMPGMNGLDFLRACRAQPRLAGIAIVMLSAVSDARTMALAAQEGITAFIVKPALPATFARKLAEVEQWLAARETVA